MREGINFSVMQSLPIDFKEYYKSKRNFSMIICSFGSVFYIILAGIICIVMNIVSFKSFRTIILGAAMSFFLNLIFINIMLLKNSVNPNFNWDSETEFSRKLSPVNIALDVIGFIFFMMSFVFVSAFSKAKDLIVINIVALIFVACLIVSAVLSVVFNNFAVKKAAENLAKLE